MHITADRSTLVEIVNRARNVVPSRTTQPILEYLKLDAQAQAAGGRLTVQASDSARWYVEHRDTGIDVIQPGAVAVEADSLSRILRALPEGSQVRLSLQKDRRLRIEAGRARHHLPTMDPAEIVDLPDEPAGLTLSVAGAALRVALEAVSPAMSTEETRYYLNGVYMHMAEPGLTLVATDAHRLARRCIEAEIREGDAAKLDMILPRETVTLACKFAGDGPLDMQAGETFARFSGEGWTLFSRLVSGTYPDYVRVIPKNCSNTTEFDREALIRAVERVSLLAEGKARVVALRFGEGEMAIIAKGKAGADAVDWIDCTTNAKSGLLIGINAAYLRAALDRLTGDRVVCQFDDPQSPTLWTATPDSPDVAVVMPAALNQLLTVADSIVAQADAA